LELQIDGDFAANLDHALICSSPIAVVTDVDFGSTFFGTPYPNPNIPGATGTDSFSGDRLSAGHGEEKCSQG
jgi:hypothetical protein